MARIPDDQLHRAIHERVSPISSIVLATMGLAQLDRTYLGKDQL